MISVTRLNHTPVILNSDLIEHIETTPDTVITLTTGQKFMVLESTEQIIQRVLDFRREIIRPAAETRHSCPKPPEFPSEDRGHGSE